MVQNLQIPQLNFHPQLSFCLQGSAAMQKVVTALCQYMHLCLTSENKSKLHFLAYASLDLPVECEVNIRPGVKRAICRNNLTT